GPHLSIRGLSAAWGKMGVEHLSVASPEARSRGTAMRRPRSAVRLYTGRGLIRATGRDARLASHEATARAAKRCGPAVRWLREGTDGRLRRRGKERSAGGGTGGPAEMAAGGSGR